VAGVCVCPAGQTLCSGTCTNTANDPSNCGGCGTTCGGLMVCATGTCTPCGGGFFKPQVTYATGAGVDALALGDVYGRGKLDVVVGYGNADVVQTLLGAGDGTLGH